MSYLAWYETKSRPRPLLIDEPWIFSPKEESLDQKECELVAFHLVRSDVKWIPWTP